MRARAWLWLGLAMALLGGAMAVLSSLTSREELFWQARSMAYPPGREGRELQR